HREPARDDVLLAHRRDAHGGACGRGGDAASGGGGMSATAAAPSAPGFPSVARHRRGGTWNVFRVERRKLSSQLAIRLLALVCVVGPFLFAAILRAQSGSPADALYGVWVHSSGFALSLVVL